MSVKQKIKVLCIIGGPGSGKTSVCNALSKALGYKLIKIGVMIEKFSKNTKLPLEAETREIITKSQKEGQLIPDFNVVVLVHSALVWEMSVNKIHKFILDGFPRTKVQLDSFLKNDEDIEVEAIIFLLASEKVMLDRTVIKHSQDSKINEEVFKKKLNSHVQATLPLLKLIPKKINVLDITTDGPLDDVLKKILTNLKL